MCYDEVEGHGGADHPRRMGSIRAAVRAGEGRGGLAVSLAAAAPCELCAALWDRRVPDSALANAAGARARNGASCGAASCPKDLQRMISPMLPSSHPRVATHVIQLTTDLISS